MTIAITFNNSTITGASDWNETASKRVLESIIPCRDGGVVGSKINQESRVITVKGKLINTTDTGLRTALNALSASLAVGQAKLTLHNDRYVNAVCKDFEHDYLRGRAGNGIEYNIQFACYDPYFYANSATTANTSATSIATGFTVTATPTTGSVNTYPVFTVTPSGGSLTLLKIENTNATIDRFIQIEGTVTTGSPIVIDCLNKTVTVNGLDAMYLTSGDFFALVGGAANVIAFSGTGANVTASTTYSDRWL